MTTARLLFEFTIPGTPVAKGRTRSTVRRGKGGKPILTANGQPIISNYTPKSTVNYEATVKAFAAQAIGGAGAVPLGCAIDLFVEFRFAIPDSWSKWQKEMAAQGLIHHTKKPDCSNLVKAIEDACNGIVYKDDGQVVGVCVDKVFTIAGECTVVRGYQRTGAPCSAKKPEAMLATAGYVTQSSLSHLPLGRRWRP